MADVFARIKTDTLPVAHAVAILIREMMPEVEHKDAETFEQKSIDEWLEWMESQMFSEPSKSHEEVRTNRLWRAILGDAQEEIRLSLMERIESHMRNTPSMFREENGQFYCIEPPPSSALMVQID